MADSDVRFTVSGFIARPVHDVFEAVADPDELSHYFTTGGAVGRLETGATVQWDFADFPGAFPVHVVEVVPDERIVLEWGGEDAIPDEAGDGTHTTVTMTFEPTEDDRTLVSITEEGWQPTEARPQGVLRQLHGLDRDDRRRQGLGRARHQPARGLLQVAPRRRRRGRLDRRPQRSSLSTSLRSIVVLRLVLRFGPRIFSQSTS